MESDNRFNYLRGKGVEVFEDPIKRLQRQLRKLYPEKHTPNRYNLDGSKITAASRHEIAEVIKSCDNKNIIADNEAKR